MATSRVEIKNPAGFNSSLEAADLPDAVWTDTQNTTFRYGKSFRKGGNNGMPLAGFLGGNNTYQAEEGTTPVWFGFNFGSINKFKAGVSSDASRTTGGAYTGDLFEAWSVTNLNTVVVASNGVDVPQSKLQSDANFKDLPNWPATYRCSAIKAYKNYLIAMGISSGATQYPSTVKWSSPADPGQVPFSWDVASVTSDAGENSLSDSTGVLVDGCSLRDSFILYKNTSVYSMTYVGGTFIFSFRKLFDNAGVMARDCVVEFDSGHFVFGQDDVYVHNGVQKQSIIYGKAKEELFSSINRNQSSKCFVVMDPSRNEIWCCYPENTGAGFFCTAAFVYNWLENTWTKRSMPQSTNGAFWGIISNPASTWDAPSYPIWVNFRNPWQYTPAGNTNKGLGFGNTVYDDLINYQSVGTGFNVMLEKTGMDLGDDRNVKVLTSITPHLSGFASGPITITLGSQDSQDGDVNWQAPLTFNAGVDYKVDCRTVGRYLAVKFEWISTATEAQLSGFTGEFQALAGRR